MYNIIMHKRVIKFISTRNPKEKQQIKSKFKQLQQNPYPSNKIIDLKKLQNENGFRLRINDYRFIYNVSDGELTIYMEKAGNRGDIY